MTGDIDFNASASAEANIVKIGDPTLNVAPTVNLNLGAGGTKPYREPFIQRFLSGTKKALNPVEYAQEQAEALAIRADAEAEALASRQTAIAEACRICLQTQPWMTEKQAYLHVTGHPVTPAEADNVFEVFEEASAQLPEGIDPSDTSAEFQDASVKGAAGAYDDEARELWARIIAGELERKGSYPKGTMDVLRGMDARMIGLFKKLCSTCVGRADGIASIVREPLPLLVYDEGSTSVFNGGLLSLLDIHELEAAGVLFTGLHRTYTVETIALVGVNNVPYQIMNETDGKKEIVFENGLLSDAGARLSNLCGTGSFEQLPNLLAKVVKKGGMRIFRLERTDTPGTFETFEM
ncbi:DUF2806 domain-containing protein [Gordonibacter massiliensis (ex Traore et al. 2017)]|uniref:DUF2806 domain-containing protein n=1 Tax=Gordonibacter massiliensis (ex Traore et al. 2017) TaxID=1841863 RepID=UPI001C8C4C88|nr:DUF2806 domain-containing protein [Gordonibacter massiliensis (ex Traore et al. 2017)]MBX9035078.1 DUF2806 domain-containing protein [Gordonibacter massiliensis (ex Traore et al. 2017)]